MSVGDYQARNFWELCVIGQIASGNLPSGNPVSVAIRDADAALVAWRERWEKIPEAAPAVSPFTSDGNPAEAHSPDEGGDDYAPPVPGWHRGIPHRMFPVSGNRYCGECGGGKLHKIHILKDPTNPFAQHR